MNARSEDYGYEDQRPREISFGRVPYWGATELELDGVSRGGRLLAMSDQRRMFPHEGIFELTSNAIILGGWRAVERGRVAGVDLTFTPAYSRRLAGGVRGNAASLGIFGDLGKPLVIGVVGESPVYLLLGFRWFWGTNRNRAWYPTIAAWLAGPATGAGPRRRGSR
jgi:hypothetical protein